MKRVVAVCILLLIPALANTAVIAGGDTVSRVAEGDNLLITAKLGVDPATITVRNNLDPSRRFQPGEELRFTTRKIAPKMVDNGIIVDIPGRMLFYFKAGRLEISFPVGLGMPEWAGMTRWRTPAGAFTITGKEESPVWHVPESIQWKMKIEGKQLVTTVPPGPNNPLGRFALHTSLSGIAIHETIWPETVYQFRSHGCIRVLPENIGRFYGEVEEGTQGELVYEPVKVAVTKEGRIFLEVNPDVYRKVGKLLKEAMNRINDLHVGAEVDWVKVRKIVKERSGNAEDVTLFPAYVPKR